MLRSIQRRIGHTLMPELLCLSNLTQDTEAAVSQVQNAEKHSNSGDDVATGPASPQTPLDRALSGYLSNEDLVRGCSACHLVFDATPARSPTGPEQEGTWQAWWTAALAATCPPLHRLGLTPGRF